MVENDEFEEFVMDSNVLIICELIGVIKIKSELMMVVDCIDDFVCMYLCEMGSVELLLWEGEIVIVKCIEVGCEIMI